MSMLVPLLRSCEAQAGSTLSKLLYSQLIGSRGCGQCTYGLSSNAQAPFLQLQQLHTSAALAAAAAQSAVAAAGASSSDSGSSSSSNSSPSTAHGAAGQLQPLEPGGIVSSLLSGLGSQQLGAPDIGLYYDLNRALLPEAFQPFHQAFYSPRPSRQQRKGGCRGLQAELALTSSSSLMWRRASQELRDALASGAAPVVALRGAPGSGKSLAVVQMVEWARSSGWIVMYVPSASALTRGGFFYPRPSSSSSSSSSAATTYDTIISAQHILKSMADSHAAQLAALPLTLDTSKQLAAAAAPAAAGAAAGALVAEGCPSSKGSGKKKGPQAAAAAGGGGSGSIEGSLMQLVAAGLSTDDDAALAVDCVLALIAELAAVSAQQPVLLAVDDYNALYWTTEYGRTLFRQPKDGPAYSVRKPLAVEQLNLARNMRLLERSDLGSCRVLVADSATNRVGEGVEVPPGAGAVYHMPRFSEVETAHALHYYHERGLTAQPPSARQVAAMRALTNGSGSELRRWCLAVSQTDAGLL